METRTSILTRIGQVISSIGSNNIGNNTLELSEKDIEKILEENGLLKTYNTVNTSWIAKYVEEYVNKTEKVKKNFKEERINIKEVIHSKSLEEMRKIHDSKEEKSRS